MRIVAILIIIFISNSVFAQKSLTGKMKRGQIDLQNQGTINYVHPDHPGGVLVNKFGADGIIIAVGAKTKNPWDISLHSNSIIPARKSDLLVGTVDARVAKSAKVDTGKITVALKQSKAPWETIVSRMVAIDKNWKTISIYGFPETDYKVGDLQVQIMLGYQKQTLEFKNIEATNYGKDYDMNKFPELYRAFNLSPPNAIWREAAAERIEKYRKGNLKVVVTDDYGEPVSGADVFVQMKRHAFPFGSCVDHNIFSSNDEDSIKYKNTFKQLFNTSVLENGMKWALWENERDRKLTIKTVKWLEENNITIRGHTLVWPGWEKQNPMDLKNLNRKQLQSRINDHIKAITGAFRGRIYQWDVVNEARLYNDFQNKINGDLTLREWFEVARSAAHDAKLYYNDFDLISNKLLEQQQSFKIAKNLLDKKAPIDGIGFQCHFQKSWLKPEQMLEAVENFAALGLDLMITEFDIDTDQEQVQAHFERDFYTLMFSHPQVKGILRWGFWEGAHWRPHGAMFRRDWSEKPNAQVYRDLIFKQWWTNESGSTDKKGSYQIRGFLGDYEIVVKYKGKKINQTIKLNENKIVQIKVNQN